MNNMGETIHWNPGFEPIEPKPIYELQDVVPLPALHIVHVCDRSPESFDTVRKFVAECGSKFEVRLTRHGKIRSIRKQEPCIVGCKHCLARIAKIRELIEAGK